MDVFGIEQAMKGMAFTYFQSSRRTGRTVSMVDGLKEGDKVCFSTAAEAKRVRRMCKDRGFEIGVVVVDPAKPSEAFAQPTAQGRFVFDHSWVEQYYLNAIENAAKNIDNFQKFNSGFGEAHIETGRKAIEISKWRAP